MTPVLLWGTMGPDSQKIDAALEQAVGKTESLVHLAQAWAYGRKPDGSPNYAVFPAAMLQPPYARGSLALLDWASWDLNNKADPAFSLDAVNAGQHDAFVHAWAQAAAAFAKPILLRFDWEMNGSWFPWGGLPVAFVAAWKKLHGIFAAEGATNVAWLWCPNVGAPAGTRWSTATDKLPSYYPGDDMVDWTGLDTYNWSSGNGGPWMSLDQIMNGYAGWYGPTYDAIAKIAPAKPMALAEWGCWDDPRKPLWLADALARIPAAYPLVRAVTYFNWNADGALWTLSGESQTAVKAGLASPVYLPAGAYVPSDRAPLAAPALNVTLASPVPQSYQQRGWTSWEQVAAGFKAEADSVSVVATDAIGRAQKAEGDLQAVRTSVQVLTRVGGATA